MTHNAPQELTWVAKRRAAQDAARAPENYRNFASAEQLYLAALAQAEEFGVHDPRALTSLHDLLTFYTSNEYAYDHHKVITIGGRLLALQEENLGPRHPDLIATLDVLGDAYHWAWLLEEVGPDDADTAFRRALGLAEAHWSAAHPQVIQECEHLARHLLAIGRAGDAIPLWERCLANPGSGPESREGTALVGLAASHREIGEYVASQSYWLRLLTRQEAVLGQDNPQHSSILRQLALLDLRQGRAVEAEARLRRALALVRARPDLAAFDPVPLTRDLARALHAQGRMAEAEELFRQALAEIWVRYHNWPWNGGAWLAHRQFTRSSNAMRIWQVRGALASSLEPYARLQRDWGCDDEASRLETHLGKIQPKLIWDKAHPDWGSRTRRASGWE
jgi:tetratricopeptide (TPR) repeat protein